MHAEEDKQAGIRRSLEAEINDLRGRIKRFEQSAQDDELKQSEETRAAGLVCFLLSFPSCLVHSIAPLCLFKLV